MKKDRVVSLISTFRFPFFILGGIICSLLVKILIHNQFFYDTILLVVVVSGSIDLFKETIQSLLRRRFALDYIALLAISVGILSHEYLVSAVITLMLSGGTTLEKYGMNQAKESLTALTDRIPKLVSLWNGTSLSGEKAIEEVQVNETIVIRKGEVIPLDGTLSSEAAITDESSLTGEPFTIDKTKGDTIRSGTVNMGEMMVLTVTKVDKDSSYRRIIEIVKQAQKEKAPLIRLADKYSSWFTLVTLSLAGLAYFISGDLTRVLAVLVIATPCPLILATPIALMGGMNALAKKRIILKKLSSLEILSQLQALVFDKTGTITVGRPEVSEVIIKGKNYSVDEILGITDAIERNSLHPFAKSLVAYAKRHTKKIYHATNIHEVIGKGIAGRVNGSEYSLAKVSGDVGMKIALETSGKKLAIFVFEEKIKTDSKDIINKLNKQGLSLHLLTGDKREAAQSVVSKLGLPIQIKANCSPEDKKNEVFRLKKSGKITAMVGDGINDAPALAFADVGMVFSHEEHTASTEAADVVFLGGDLTSVALTLSIARRTIAIALQSILIGIGLSVVGMVLAGLGLIPPLLGACLQEGIDVFVILNALRASRS